MIVRWCSWAEHHRHFGFFLKLLPLRTRPFIMVGSEVKWFTNLVHDYSGLGVETTFFRSLYAKFQNLSTWLLTCKMLYNFINSELFMYETLMWCLQSCITDVLSSWALLGSTSGDYRGRFLVGWAELAFPAYGQWVSSTDRNSAWTVPHSLASEHGSHIRLKICLATWGN